MKKFTLLQLFSLVDGRLSTKMEDVYDMLNHITGESLMTHHLPVAMKFIQEKNPDWFQECEKRISEMGINKETPFEVCLAKFKNDNPTYNIPKLSPGDLEGFPNFMLNNSLLSKLGSK